MGRCPVRGLGVRAPGVIVVGLAGGGCLVPVEVLGLERLVEMRGEQLLHSVQNGFPRCLVDTERVGDVPQILGRAIAELHGVQRPFDGGNVGRPGVALCELVARAVLEEHRLERVFEGAEFLASDGLVDPQCDVLDAQYRERRTDQIDQVGSSGHAEAVVLRVAHGTLHGATAQRALPAAQDSQSVLLGSVIRAHLEAAGVGTEHPVDVTVADGGSQGHDLRYGGSEYFFEELRLPAVDGGHVSPFRGSTTW
jgi:hypothetical protein